MSDFKTMEDYKKTTTALTQDLAVLEAHAKTLEMENSEVSLHALNEHIQNDRFNLAVMGEFRRGKSTLINALLHAPVLPTDVVPCTAVVNRITYAPEPKAMVEKSDGTKKLIDINDLKNYATQDGSESSYVKEVTVWYPTIYCANNVDLYDTPGLNDSPEMTARTANEVISRMDVALFVLSAQFNFSQSEIEFLGERLLTSEVGRVIFAVTHMDEYPPEQQNKVLASVRKRVEERVLGKAKEVYEDAPDRLAEFKKKLGEIQIYGISSTMALEARKNHNDEMLQKSGFPALEHAIDEMLTKERGKVMLEKQTGMILKASNDIYNVIKTRLVPLTMDEEEYNAACEKAESEMAAIEKELQSELNRLDSAKETIKENVRSTWDGYVEGMMNDVKEIAKGLQISSADMKKKNQEQAIRRIWDEQMAPAVERRMQIYSERINEQINDAVGKEYVHLDSYADKVSEHMGKIAGAFRIKNAEGTPDNKLARIIQNYISLSGGALKNGYKIAGVKGALLGGISSSAIAGGSAVLMAFVAVAIGVTSWPVLAVTGILSGMAGLFGGDAIVKKVFKDKLSEQFKQKIGEVTCEELKKSLAEQKVENKLCEHVAKSFDAIEKEITTNTNGMLKDMRKSLQNTREDHAARKAQAEAKLQTYEDILQSLTGITGRATGVREAYGLD